MYLHAIDNFKVIAEIHVLATTSCKNVETLPRKNDLSCFKSLLVTGLWDIILTSLLPPIQSCSSKFWAWSCIASNFDKGWRGDHKHKIMDRPFIPKYGRVSQALLQLVVASRLKQNYVEKEVKKFTSQKSTVLPQNLSTIVTIVAMFLFSIMIMLTCTCTFA